MIDFEKNENLKGLGFLDQLYQAIINKQCLKITYKSFKARQESEFNYHPYLLKEFRNRWFLIGCKKPSQPIMNIALDRIIAVEKSEFEFKSKPDFNSETYFKDAIGVSVSPHLPADKIILFITHKHAPYVLTKPFHASQEVVEKDAFGVTISLQVQHNFELEKEILGLGDACKVIAPARLRRNIKDRLHFGLDLYNTEVTESNLKRSIKKLSYNGFSVLNNVYGTRELRKIRKVLDQHFTTYKERPFAIRCLLQKTPDLKELLLNKNLQQIITSIDKKAVLTKAIYFDKPAQKNWYVTWHQDITVNVVNRVEVEGYSSWTKKQNILSVCPPESILQNTFTIRIHLDDTDEKNGALKVLSGSHKKRLNDDEISIITNNSVPNIVEVGAGGIMLMKPLLLHASSKAQNQKRRRVIHLEFTSSLLSKPLTFLEEEKS